MNTNYSITAPSVFLSFFSGFAFTFGTDLMLNNWINLKERLNRSCGAGIAFLGIYLLSPSFVRRLWVN